jgi:hypothetical protein
MGSIPTFTQENEMNPVNDVQLNDLKSYLLGAMHDGTVRQRTLRISQREEEYVVFLQSLILAKGKRAWTYREGHTRNLFVVEFSRTLLDGHRLRTRKEIIHYVRGYFDAEGSVASPAASAPYLYFGQKNRLDLEELRSLLCGLRVTCGKIHNPSCQVDPDYWRFFVSRRSIERFAKLVGSWHPRKARWLDEALNRARKPRRNSKPRRSLR